MRWARLQWDRAAALLAVVVGVVALLLGWDGASNNVYVAKQVPYVISGALFGLFMVGVAAVLWLSADLRDEWRELRGIRLMLGEEAQARMAVNGSGQTSAAESHTMAIPAVTDLG